MTQRCSSLHIDKDGVGHHCTELLLLRGAYAGQHRGPHRCGVPEHDVPDCADGCCFAHPNRGATWPNTPEIQARDEWSIGTAVPGDKVLGDPSWPLHRALTVLWNGKNTVVLEDGHDPDREHVYRHREWNWYPIHLESRP